MLYSIETFEDYRKWFSEQTNKFQGQIESRLQRIVNEEHFGLVNSRLTVDGRQVRGLAELKFNNGGRIYFTTMLNEDGRTVFLLLGGGKNGQAKDIKKAARLLKENFD